jgi:uncharacterized protein YlxP (DUF503 family)
MVIAAAKIVLDFWGNEEPRHKKQLIEKLSQQLQSAHHVSLTEVDDFESLESCVLGLSFCSAEMKSAQNRMKNVLEFIDKHSAARVVSEDSDFQIFD